MHYQIDTRDVRRAGIRVGRDDAEVAVFARAKALFHHISGIFEDIEYQMKLPAPWTGFRYRVLGELGEVASAKRQMQMHAFEPDRPLIRHNRVDFELDVGGRPFRLVPEDRFGLNYLIVQGDDRRGSLAQRDFADQENGSWSADLDCPDDWPVPLVAFVAWLTREGRRTMSM